MLCFNSEPIGSTERKRWTYGRSPAARCKMENTLVKCRVLNRMSALGLPMPERILQG
jgi:hypothetical protein